MQAMPPQTDPYTIYARARAVWETARYPHFLSYTVDVRVSEGGRPKTNHYHLSYDSQENKVTVNPVSDEESAHPHTVPPGPKLGFFGLPLGKPEPRTDLLGVPQLAPNYSFGIARYVPGSAPAGMDLVREIRAEFHDPAPLRTAPPNGLKEIANVQAVSKTYTMSLSGIETIDGHPDYHLLLQPVREPKRYRLRELWIDERTYFTDRLRSDGNFVSGPGPGVAWTVNFAQNNGAPYIASETADGVLAYPGAVYGEVSISFEDVRAAQSPPPYAAIQAFVNHGDSLQEP